LEKQTADLERVTEEREDKKERREKSGICKSREKRKKESTFGSSAHKAL
jgi:hypothetical protein